MAGLHRRLLPRPEQAGVWEGSCLAEQFQVGDRDLALFVASLANEPVRVHARQAVDSDELKRRVRGKVTAWGRTGPQLNGDRAVILLGYMAPTPLEVGVDLLICSADMAE